MCYKTQQMCVKAVGTCPFFYLNAVADLYKIQSVCGKPVFNNHFMLRYCSGRYKTHKICHKIIDDFLPALKFVLDLFVISEMIKNLAR